ncbi:ca2+-modulated nonselective cation channel polycystin protein [Coniochaeta hoffmannii]|uniref:Ca2+-modulated nonselective cation channel polycystin protein n=1 Tax=Coniochaeta hoffmannii TaxID=91930 RepID=A0AA38VNA6_9PEZI|nr:ca2+-modulated nonselective cation channel polycystin protein [Coniochaeta hoffmannii]
MTETSPPAPHERSGRRRPFSNLMKKLANFKSVSSNDSNRQTNSKRSHVKTTPKSKQSKQNNPYPQSGRIGISESEEHGRYSASTARSTGTSATSLARDNSARSSIEEEGLRAPPTAGGRSMAPTISTENETSRSTAASHGASSITGTSRTANVGNEFRRGGDSTFSSPAPSVRSLTTTLTTIQSMAPNGTANPAPVSQQQSSGHHPNLSNSQVIHFNQPFPTTSPASAIPAHLTPNPTTNPGHPTTYSSATANNLLTDNASILTLASSSKRRRRRSFDTDASVRALAPSSLFGGSRESLPLSVLSATVDGGAAGPTTPGLHGQRGQPAAERTSIYSASGILASERNSYYAKQNVGGPAGAGDGASVRSGLLGHGRADSISGSIGGMGPTSALASPREMEGEDEDHQRSSGLRGQRDGGDGGEREQGD